jgi:long-chain acyl-CoA synthetase
MTATTFACAADAPDQLALADASRELTWREAADEVSRTASAMLALGLPPGARIAVVGNNNAATLMAYAGALVAGIGTILVGYHLTADEVSYQVRDGGAAAIWADDDHEQIATQVATETRTAVLSGSRWRAAVARAATRPPSLDRSPTADLIYTSGTTGRPKGVAFPYDLPSTVAARLEVVRAHHSAGLGPHLVAGPLYHSGPHAAVGLLLVGTPVVILGRFDPQRALAAISRHRIASTLMVPTHFVRLLALSSEQRDAADLSSLRLIVHTGSPCPPDVKRSMIDWVGPILRESYGGSESGVLAAITSPEWLERPGSVGRVLPQFELEVRRETGESCLPGEVGVLWFRDTTGRGIAYHDDPVKTAAAHLEPGMFTLGDVGHVDQDGYLFVTGRVTDMVISGGVNIYPAECERVLRAHPAIVDVAMFAVPDADLGERLVGAAVSIDPAVDASALVEHCRSQLAGYKVPREIHLVDELPRTPMGKIDKWALAHHVAALHQKTV